MRVAVFGASGATGRLVVVRLLERGNEVTAFVRDPSQLDIEDARLRIDVGDALDAAAVDAAVDGCDAVVSLLAARLDQPVGTVRSQGTENVIAAMRRHGVRRLVAVSAVGGRRSTAQMGAVTRWLYRRKIGAERLAEVDRLEDLVVGTDLVWTLVRPPRLVDEQPDGRPTASAMARVSLSSKLSRTDLADILVEQVSRDGDRQTALTALSAAH